MSVDYRDAFNTILAPEDEALFQEWLRRSGRRRDLEDYDLRAAWASGQIGADGNGHMTDLGKKPNHPTFSDESKYSTQETPGGHWGDGMFIPSPQMLRDSQALRELEQYFKMFEPDTRLQLPPMDLTKMKR